MSAPAPRKVFAVTVRPEIGDARLILGVFAAASETFGVDAVDDVVTGPHSSAVVVAAPPQGRCGRSRDLRRAVRRSLRRLGHLDLSVEVYMLPVLGASAMAEMVDLWVGRARATSGLSATRRAYREAIAELLDRQAIRTFFQPIVDLTDGRIVGYEALSRGPRHHPLEGAAELLSAAATAGRTLDVDRAMAWLATTRAAARLPDHDLLLFLNATGELPWWRSVSEQTLLPRWPADRVVIEFSEHTPIRPGDEAVLHRERARGRGLRFALDDTGAGFAGLTTLALVDPDFVKVDISLVRGCDGDRLKQQIISSLKRMGGMGRFEVVAEGVETAAELETLRRLGVRLAQGYLLGLPQEHPGPDDAAGVPWLAPAESNTA